MFLLIHIPFEYVIVKMFDDIIKKDYLWMKS